MIRRSVGITLMALLLSFLAFPTSPAVAVSVEHDHAGPWTEPPGNREFYFIGSNAYGRAYFAPYGEWFELSDDNPDGYSVVTNWHLYDIYGRVLRSGKIWFSYGYDVTGWKNKSFPENHWISVNLCRGNHSKHEVHYYTCTEWKQIRT